MEMGDRSWKFGFFYVNRDDPAVFVPKRYGIGYTLNFGNRWSWAVLGLIGLAVAMPLSVPVVILYTLKHHHLPFQI